MKKSLHIIKGCFCKLTTIIISTDDSIMYTNFGKFSCCSWIEFNDAFSDKDINPALVS